MTSKPYLNYIICSNCKNILDMSFVNTVCPNPLCEFDFKGLSALLDRKDNEVRNELLEARRDKNEHKIKLLTTAIRFNIVDYLVHFIQCSWGSHYNAIFRDFIILYLDDLNALKITLRSDAIKPKNRIVSRNGYKMFWDLYQYLIRVNNSKIRQFLILEFPEYHKRWHRRMHKKLYPNKHILNDNQTKLL